MRESVALPILNKPSLRRSPGGDARGALFCGLSCFTLLCEPSWFPKQRLEIDPVVNMTAARIQEDINRLQAESMSWESLLNKHRSKAEELDKCVERGEEKGLPLDPSCFAKSSQSRLILNKPDYKAVLMGQQKLLRNMELVMDSQCCIMRELLSFREKSQLLLKETSARLAARAGFHNLPSSPVRQLIKGPISSVSS
ncbi:hypothetical protein cypCar_00013254 [Cyprinus carpio]|nr:hypothetical protein cypCar_00013254 [Cyprinus carpio]